MSNIQFRNFCFTLNNYTDDEVTQIKESDKYQYIIWGKEVGANGTPHLQGYCELRRRARTGAISRYPGFRRCHIEARRGTQLQAIEYCQKDGDWEEHGEKKVQGRRTDIESVRALFREPNVSLRGIMEVASSYQAIKVAQVMMPYFEPSRNWVPEVVWIWGDAGTGKTRLARNLCGEICYQKGDSSKWFEGYDGDENVILDDYRFNWMEFNDFLTLLDRYPRRVECKGGSRQFVAKKIFITSIFRPEDCYQVHGEDLEQLMRRLSNVIHLEDNQTWTQYALTQEELIDLTCDEPSEV